MANCANCEAPLKPGAKFCPECGTPVESLELHCPSCGEAVPATVKFCPSCGQNLTEKVAEPASPLPVEPLEPTPTGRNWKAMALPLLIIPIFVLIALLLTRRNQGIEPSGGQATAGTTSSVQGGQGTDMEMMEKVRTQINDLKAALETNPSDTTAMLSLAQMYEIAGRYETAAEYYQKYLKLYPNTPQVEMALANTQFRQGRFDDALKVVTGLLKRHPKNELALYNLGVLYAHANKTDEAVKAWQKVIDLNPKGDMARAAQEGIKQLKQMKNGSDG